MSTENFTGDKPLGAFSALKTTYTYSWINNQQFYSIVPHPYRNYYFRFIKNYFYWYDGFVPYFHSETSGMMATKLSKAIVHKLSKLVVGNKLMYDDDGVKDTKEIEYDGKKLNSLDFVEAWAKNHKLDTKVQMLKEWAMVGGDAIIKLDNLNGELYPSILRKDSYFFSTDFKGMIDEFTGFIYTYTSMTNHSDTKGESQYYYLLEERRYNESGQPQIRLSMKHGTGSMGNMREVDDTPETIPFERLPRNISHKFRKDYPNTKLGEWQDLALKDLGIYLDKASENVSFLPALPFGESILSSLIHLLMTYDFYFSSLVTNIYTSRDKVLMPQHMQNPTGQQDVYAQNFNQGFDAYITAQAPYVSPENQTPVVLQFDTRDAQWKGIRDNLLQSVAMILNVSDRTISSSIVPNSEKPTAREIGSDEFATTNFVEHQQGLLKHPLDDMLETLLDFYNFEDEEVTVKFSKAGLTNLNNVSTIVTIMKQNNLIDTKTALEMFFTDKNEKQISNIMDAIDKEKEVAMEQEMKQNEETDTEEVNEQNATVTENQVPKPKKKGLFGRKK